MSLRAIPLLLAITTCMAISTAHAVTTGTLRFTGQINAGTCNLAAGDVSRTVTLPTVKVPDFNNALFTGQTSFEISADCESDIRNVTFLFAGTPDTGNGALFNNTGTSAGLGVWLRAGAGTTRTVVPDGQQPGSPGPGCRVPQEQRHDQPGHPGECRNRLDHLRLMST